MPQNGKTFCVPTHLLLVRDVLVAGARAGAHPLHHPLGGRHQDHLGAHVVPHHQLAGAGVPGAGADVSADARGVVEAVVERVVVHRQQHEVAKVVASRLGKKSKNIIF